MPVGHGNKIRLPFDLKLHKAVVKIDGKLEIVQKVFPNSNRQSNRKELVIMPCHTAKTIISQLRLPAYRRPQRRTPGADVEFGRALRPKGDRVTG